MSVRLARTTGALVLAAALSACSGGSTSSAPSTAPPSTAGGNPSITPVPTASQVTDSPSAVPSASPIAGGKCAGSQLVLSVGPSQGAAGTDYQPLQLKNTGAACTLQGFPGVALLSSTGAQLGEAADRSGSSGSVVRLATGEVAHAVLGIANAGNYPAAACKPGRSASVQVYPPGDTTRLTAPLSVLACTTMNRRQLHVTTVSPGSG